MKFAGTEIFNDLSNFSGQFSAHFLALHSRFNDLFADTVFGMIAEINFKIRIKDNILSLNLLHILLRIIRLGVIVKHTDILRRRL